LEAFDKFDKNHDGKLNYREYKPFGEAVEAFGKKLLGPGGVEWSPGIKNFFWTMMDSVSDGSWNHGHRREGRGNVTKRDLRRLDRILKEVYKDVEESSDSDDEEDDKKVEEPKEEAKKDAAPGLLFEDEEMFLI
jgi:hypothetical protein